MQFQVILGTLALAMMTSAVPTAPAVESVKLSQVQVKNLLDVLKTQSTLAADQAISCTVAYTLALSAAGPPYTIDLTTFDLSNCTYSGP
ncbi:uncharacterized protein N7477_006451 [Penicillium maclennaniae]|uniref:uncharacterized protein n=1 Tax=Penicillium maclennaniae TaxID=1343394 RepID=UPI00253FC4A9|nr:uncharacterized protein N7477_006451 [Penicillium maclennaniae]KAJ5667881.1 hypothetical protein N7477_006451 [Penicillium maclennaniae]